MRLFLVLATVVLYIGLLLAGTTPLDISTLANPFSSKVQPKEVILGKDAKATGQGSKSVLFTHDTHSLKNYSVDGKSVIGCAECHHTDQPKRALKGMLRTSEREEMLTTASLEKADAKPVKTCRECHAQAGVKPALWPANPEVTYPDESDPITLTNEEAYHRNCNVCHDAVKRRNPATKAPVTCLQCHNGGQGVSGGVVPNMSVSPYPMPSRTPARQLPPTLSFRSREDTFRRLAETLASEGRLEEATNAVSLLKKEEYFNFTGRDTTDPTPIESPVSLNSKEAEGKNDYSEIKKRLVSIIEERRWLRAKQARTDKEQERLDELEADFKVAGKAFNGVVYELFNEFGTSRGAIARIFYIKESRALMQDLKELGSGTVALYTIVGKDKYRVILITPDVSIVEEVAITAEALGDKVRSFREALQAPRGDPLPQAQAMYDILVRPVAKHLKDIRAETLMWSLDGPLRYLPFAALHDKEKYLVESYRNTVFTPASLARLKDAPREKWRVLGLGVSKAQPGFPALPAVPAELRGIIRQENEKPPAGVLGGKRILDEEFTLKTMQRGLQEEFTVLHIASHFHLQRGTEADSFLLLGDGSRLTLSELGVYQNPFGGIDLVTLSACGTAVGHAEATGREVESFGVLAQELGAKAVIASLWNVPDESTSQLMQEFYRLRAAQPKRPKAEALRLAQLTLLKARKNPAKVGKDRGIQLGIGKTGAQVNYVHPYFWAPFILIGNWR